MLSWPEKIKLMRRACLLCDRAACNYKVGCLAVRDSRVVVEAFNETLPEERYCQKGVCVREKRRYSGGQRVEIVCTLHAEASVVEVKDQPGHTASEDGENKGCQLSLQQRLPILDFSVAKKPFLAGYCCSCDLVAPKERD